MSKQASWGLAVIMKKRISALEGKHFNSVPVVCWVGYTFQKIMLSFLRGHDKYGKVEGNLPG